MISGEKYAIPIILLLGLLLGGQSWGTGFSISRVALRFDDGSPMRLIQRQESLEVFAHINFSGTGLLKGTWELAGPTSTAGKPSFRTLRAVRRHLVASESPEALESPHLPTDLVGLYLVRLRITDPKPGFELPVIRYFVGEAAQANARPAPMVLAKP